MMYTKIDANGELVDKKCITLKELRTIHKNITFPNRETVSAELLAHLGYAEVLPAEIDPTAPKPAADKMYYDIDVIKNDKGKWQRVVALKTLTAEETEARIQRKWEFLRNTRDKLLQATDYTAAVDSRQFEIYKEYRQKLRDLPSTNTDPFLIVFPIAPVDQVITKEVMVQAVQNYIDSTVQALGYDNSNSIAKYLVEGNYYYEECKTISIWIGSVWVSANQLQADVIAGIKSISTIDQLLAELPVYVS